MTILFYLVIFILGTVLGSFYNVVGLRLPLKKSIIAPRSSCTLCQTPLTPLQLIPVLSYLLNAGKCLHCKGRISFIYPIVEFLTGSLFVLAFIVIGWEFELWVALAFISLLMIILVSDLSYMVIPDKVVAFFTILFLTESLFNHYSLSPLWNSLLGAATGLGLLAVIILISKGGMGGGDMKLFGVIGLVLGWELVLLAFFLSTFIGTIVGMLGLITGRIKRQQPFPFGPFIVIGSLITYFWGNEIISLYIQVFYLV
ncbi:leader peptidase (prepilin peptidase)/N-methyltransferase [Bacillus mesophilus]|uniref:Prepilin leader peptidase/N-methyltransferase n=1 Tax=Bacillus mesophilus TaxID=1808955 RepID=A0A6M0Q8F7_9BACI|nr:A24 family peptidase [Bacillus mesophilus]MBM7660652.1 leader peptidase (prepilin peptidase)/N-methyltransferase [Bacillus mesophilus]NEY71800.1 prepilin peptidase [Bacillus mesophilus]